MSSLTSNTLHSIGSFPFLYIVLFIPAENTGCLPFVIIGVTGTVNGLDMGISAGFEASTTLSGILTQIVLPILAVIRISALPSAMPVTYP